MPSKCLGKDRHMNPCKFKVQHEETKFCKNHQYMNMYTDTQLESLTICTGCKKAYYLENRKICDVCKSRSKVVREQQSQVIQPGQICQHEPCKNKKYKDTSYCKLHEIYIWVDQVKASGKIPCTQYKRGCRNVLETDAEYKRCEPCRKAEREKDKAKRDQAKTQNAESAKNASQDTKVCTTCGKTHNKDAFVGEHSVETLTCIHCRNNGKIQDRKRDQEHRRKQGRIYDSKESRKRQKKEWKKNNWDKVVRAWKHYRERQRTKDENAYLKKNAENAKQWRQNNLDAVEAINTRKKENIHCQYAVYVQSSKHRNIHFELTVDEYISIAQNPCYYCGTVNEKRGFNGVDRVDNSLGYNTDNCVACCSMCNFIKGSLHHDIFLRRVEHTMSFLGLITGNLYPECFPNIKNVTYNSYLNSAEKRSLEFQLTYEEFGNIINQDCYICGKKNDTVHKNGIDRINNKIGYSPCNCKACCRECNFMKSTLTYDNFIEKYTKIRQLHLNTCTQNRDNGKYKCESRKKTN